MITDLYEIVQAQRDNNYCFQKNESFVCFNENRTKTISIDTTKKYLTLTRKFIEATKEIN